MATESFEHNGQTFTYDTAHRQTLNMGSLMSVIVADESGSIVLEDDSFYYEKGQTPEAFHAKLAQRIESANLDATGPSL